MRNLLRLFYPHIASAVIVVICTGILLHCSNGLKKENEQLREEIARQQQYVPLQRDTIRDTIEVVTQKVVEVERVKEVLSKEDKSLLKDINTRLSALESFQKMGTETKGDVVMSPATLTDDNKPDSLPADSLFLYKDAWIDLTFNLNNRNMSFRMQDSLAISVEREYKKRFLWWRWGVKGYQVKATSFSPYTTIKYNTYVKRRR